MQRQRAATIERRPEDHMLNGDILIHIDEELDDSGIQALERGLSREQGVLSACTHQRARHLLLVDFDCAQVRPADILRSVRGQGLHAQMIGL
jgi:hypothetical protein